MNTTSITFCADVYLSLLQFNFDFLNISIACLLYGRGVGLGRPHLQLEMFRLPIPIVISDSGPQNNYVCTLQWPIC
jgi:hypothetical protein